MVELFAFAALGIVALVGLDVLMMIGTVLRFAFKITFLPLAIVGRSLGLIALAVMIPVGLSSCCRSRSSRPAAWPSWLRSAGPVSARSPQSSSRLDRTPPRDGGHYTRSSTLSTALEMAYSRVETRVSICSSVIVKGGPNVITSRAGSLPPG